MRLSKSLSTIPILCAVLLGGLSGCNRLTSSGSAARDDLALVPSDTAAVFMLNLKQARGTRLWQKLLEIRDKDETSRKEYQDFIQKCHLDPLKDFDSFFLAVPPNAQQSREYALLLRGHYDPDAIVACARRIAEDRHEELKQAEYNGVQIYNPPGQGPELAVLGKRAVVIAGPSSLRQVIDLHTGKKPASASARDNKELQAMLQRTNTGVAFFFAGQVPGAMAERLRGSPQLGAAASLHSISGSIDLAKGLTLHADLDLGSDADASALASSVNNWLVGLHQDSRLQLMGLTSYLDTLQVGARKATFLLDLRMSDNQLDDLSTRLAGLSRSLAF
jgi:hypothetical protein